MSELKPEVEYVIKTGRQVVEKKQVDFPDKLNGTLDAIKHQYNSLGAQVIYKFLNQISAGVVLIHNLFQICDVTCQNQTNVGICQLPENKFEIILVENIIFFAN